jgi:hypothetical protein
LQNSQAKQLGICVIQQIIFLDNPFYENCEGLMK